jgi:hypothetical protein
MNSVFPRSLPGVLDASEESRKIHQNHTQSSSGENAQDYPITVPKLPTNRDGDMYQEIRWYSDYFLSSYTPVKFCYIFKAV